MPGPWQCLATIRDCAEVGLPPPANPKPPAEQRRALLRASGFFQPFTRKLYSSLALHLTEWLVTSSAGTASHEGAPTGDAADVRLEVVAGGAISGGAVTAKLSRDAGATVASVSTFGSTFTVPSTGIVEVDGVTITLSGTWAQGEAVTYTAGPDPGIRWAVAAIASHAMYYNRGANPAAMAPYQEARDKAIEWGQMLAKGVEAELDQKVVDATPGRAEGGPLWTRQSRAQFLAGKVT